MSKQTTKAVDQAAPAFEPALVLYSLDEAKKAHAAAFAAPDVELAMRAAGLMGMHALPVEGAECRKLALGLPKGRIFASGKAFAPFVKKAAFEALAGFGGTVPPTPAPLIASPVEPPPPATWPTTGPATSWATLAVGELVLAPEDPEVGGWYEAVVIELKPEDIVVLRWLRWPDLPAFPRHVTALGLLHPHVPGVEILLAAPDEAPAVAADTVSEVAANEPG